MSAVPEVLHGGCEIHELQAVRDHAPGTEQLSGVPAVAAHTAPLARLGWECPGCHACYAPHIPSCTVCVSRHHALVPRYIIESVEHDLKAARDEMVGGLRLTRGSFLAGDIEKLLAAVKNHRKIP